MIELTPQEIVDTVMQVFGDQVAFRNYENDIAFGNAIVAKATAKLLKQSDDNAARARMLLDANVQLTKLHNATRALNDQVYEERNRLVALLATMALSSGIARTEIEDWDPQWHNCVYIDTDMGQLSWHYHDSQAHLFAHLKPYTQPWDGHTTEEKYKRVAQMVEAYKQVLRDDEQEQSMH